MHNGNIDSSQRPDNRPGERATANLEAVACRETKSGRAMNEYYEREMSDSDNGPPYRGTYPMSVTNPTFGDSTGQEEALYNNISSIHVTIHLFTTLT